MFKFVQGYGVGAKAGRAVFNGAADVMKLGRWKVAGIPVEVHLAGMKLPAKWVRQEPLIFRGTTIFRGITEPLQIIIGIPDKWAKKSHPRVA
jgi:hypothetical protein